MKKGKKIIIFSSLLMVLCIVIATICISNPLFATVFFSAKADYQITRIRGGNSDTKTVKKKEILALFAGKKMSRDDSLKELGENNGGLLYMIEIKGDELLVYYDNAPENAVAAYQGKYYQIKNPKYPVDFWFAK